MQLFWGRHTMLRYLHIQLCVAHTAHWHQTCYLTAQVCHLSPVLLHLDIIWTSGSLFASLFPQDFAHGATLGFAAPSSTSFTTLPRGPVTDHLQHSPGASQFRRPFWGLPITTSHPTTWPSKRSSKSRSDGCSLPQRLSAASPVGKAFVVFSVSHRGNIFIYRSCHV